MKKIIKKNPLFFAFLFPALMDGALTLLGQDVSYWNNRIVNEASPAYYALIISPWVFVIGSAFWFIFWYFVVKRLKEPLNLFLMFLFIAGHSWGSSSWIWKIMRDNNFYAPADQISVITTWSVVVLYFGLVALFATYSLKIYLEQKRL